MEDTSKAQLENLKRAVIVSMAVILALLEGFYFFVMKVPLVECVLEWLFGMSVCLGQLFQHAGSYGDAIRYFKQASAICATGLDRTEAGYAYLNAGWCLRHMDQFDEAIFQVERAAECFAEPGNKAGTAAALSIKGICLWHKQAAVGALECLRRAVGLF